MKQITYTLFALAMALTLAACGAQADTGAPTPDAGAPAPASDVTPSAAPAPASGAAQPDPNRTYALEKLNEVNDMVLNRQVVPEDYLRYLDETVAGKVEEYNIRLANAKAATVRYAKEWADTFRNINTLSEGEPGYDAAFAGYGRYLEEGDNYFRFIDEFSTALLYPNQYEFTVTGTVVGYPAGCESGGSGGLWSVGFYLDKTCIDELTAAVDDLLDQCDAARAAWAQAD